MSGQRNGAFPRWGYSTSRTRCEVRMYPCVCACICSYNTRTWMQTWSHLHMHACARTHVNKKACARMPAGSAGAWAVRNEPPAPCALPGPQGHDAQRLRAARHHFSPRGAVPAGACQWSFCQCCVCQWSVCQWSDCGLAVHCVNERVPPQQVTFSLEWPKQAGLQQLGSASGLHPASACNAWIHNPARTNPHHAYAPAWLPLPVQVMRLVVMPSLPGLCARPSVLRSPWATQRNCLQTLTQRNPLQCLTFRNRLQSLS